MWRQLLRGGCVVLSPHYLPTISLPSPYHLLGGGCVVRPLHADPRALGEGGELLERGEGGHSLLLLRGDHLGRGGGGGRGGGRAIVCLRDLICYTSVV